MEVLGYETNTLSLKQRTPGNQPSLARCVPRPRSSSPSSLPRPPSLASLGTPRPFLPLALCLCSPSTCWALPRFHKEATLGIQGLVQMPPRKTFPCIFFVTRHCSELAPGYTCELTNGVQANCYLSCTDAALMRLGPGFHLLGPCVPITRTEKRLDAEEGVIKHFSVSEAGSPRAGLARFWQEPDNKYFQLRGAFSLVFSLPPSFPPFLPFFSPCLRNVKTHSGRLYREATEWVLPVAGFCPWVTGPGVQTPELRGSLLRSGLLPKTPESDLLEAEPSNLYFLQRFQLSLSHWQIENEGFEENKFGKDPRKENTKLH